MFSYPRRLVSVKFLFVLLFSGLFPSPLSAGTEVDCPKNIAIINQSVLSSKAAIILKKIYQDLGCPINLTFLPGRRGIQNFNDNKVDGELIRQQSAEKFMQRSFVKSSPLFIVSNNLWGHPNLSIREKYPIGYLIGIFWQENYKTEKPMKSFHGNDQMFQAYNQGYLAAFPASDLLINILVEENKLIPPPVLLEEIVSTPLYHYLGKEFTPFMERFSAYIEEKKPFSILK